MDKAVEWAIMECGRGFARAVSEAREKFEEEAAENRKRVVEEDVSSLREQHNSELRKAVDRYIAEKEVAAAARTDQGAAYSGSGGGEKLSWGNCEDEERIKRIR